MRYVILDTETTGFKDWDDITQLACIVLDENKKPVKAVNRFIFTDKPLTAEVTNVTGVNKAKLHTLSGGKMFKDVIDDFYDIFYGDPETVFVGHNISFDMRMLNANLSRRGFDPLVHRGTYCTMQATKDIIAIKQKFRGKIQNKNPKLSEAYDYLVANTNVTPEFVNKIHSTLWKENASFHDARYDTTITYLLTAKYYK